MLNLLRPRRDEQDKRFHPPSLVVGLGNPGPEYAGTRHNAGFWCIDALANKHGITLERRHRSSIIGEGEIDSRRVILVKPRTFVNRSGAAVRYLTARYSMPMDKLLVVCDDINLPPGKIRMRRKGSAGGHNGIKSIIEATGSQDFPRLRIGVGRPPEGAGHAGQIEHVIGTMEANEREVVDGTVARAADAIACLLSEGIDEAMSRYN
ncbi:MAG: aminoacyl-tRNA hydrolase [Chloroflexi bacterium]|nr:aminoacyl-tRNA hydrolase [Chloroflexota bacterium]